MDNTKEYIEIGEIKLGLISGEGFLDAVAITDGTGALISGLLPTCNVYRLDTGAPTMLTVEEVGLLGIYKVTNWTPTVDTEYITVWSVAAPYIINYPFKLFKVGGGQEAHGYAIKQQPIYIEDTPILLADTWYLIGEVSGGVKIYAIDMMPSNDENQNCTEVVKFEFDGVETEEFDCGFAVATTINNLGGLGGLNDNANIDKIGINCGSSLAYADNLTDLGEFHNVKVYGKITDGYGTNQTIRCRIQYAKMEQVV